MYSLLKDGYVYSLLLFLNYKGHCPFVFFKKKKKKKRLQEYRSIRERALLKEVFVSRELEQN